MSAHHAPIMTTADGVSSAKGSCGVRRRATAHTPGAPTCGPSLKNTRRTPRHHRPNQALFGAVNWIPRWYSPDGPASSQAIADLFADFFIAGFRTGGASQ